MKRLDDKTRLRPPVSDMGEVQNAPSDLGLPPPTLPIGIGRLDNYELLERIGIGGMGIVFRAVQPDANTPAVVAVKILKPELCRNRRARDYFAKEAGHMRRMSHPNILPIIDFQNSENRPYLVMPFVRTGSLHDFLKTPRPYAAILGLLKQVASALEYAHDSGVIHRDVKPSNILVDSEGRPYLTDFGLSRSLLNDPGLEIGSDQTEGTPQYQSPAEAGGKREDTRGDIYSFGAVLYEVLTGRCPYPNLPREHLLERIRTTPPTPVLKLNPQAPATLAAVCHKAMARTLGARYPHMSYVLAALNRIKPTPGQHTAPASA